MGVTTPGTAKLNVANSGSNVGLYVGNTSPFGQAQIEMDGGVVTHIWAAEGGSRVFSVTGGGEGYFAGNVGIGVAPSSTYALDVSGNTNVTGNHSVGGNAVITGSTTALSYYHSSDARLKTDIRPIPDALDKLLSIQGVEFNWKKDGRSDMGVVAQDVAKVFPNVVSKSENGGMMTVEYDSLIGPMIEAIRTLKTENDSMKAELAEIHASLKAIKEDNTRLRSINAGDGVKAPEPSPSVEP